MPSIEYVEKRKNYDDWLKNRQTMSCEIIKGINSSELYPIKTGEVDMAGPDWPTLDDDKIYVGGYGENRIIGATDYDIEPQNMRTLHIGLDIFVPANTSIYNPIEGVIHSFKDNNNPRDYGPTIIQRHEVTPQFCFYSLMGHLSKSSLIGLEIGQKFAAGEKIANLGADTENGGWPPHLHYQIIIDMMGNIGDFPGLCKPSEDWLYLQICPNPMEFLGLK